MKTKNLNRLQKLGSQDEVKAGMETDDGMQQGSCASVRRYSTAQESTPCILIGQFRSQATYNDCRYWSKIGLH